jgi:uncharacterized protein YbaP (TraB family)
LIIKKLLTFSLLASIFISCASALAQSSVWKVSKGNKYFYLAGTIHVLNPQDYPLPSEFDKAYADADKLIFETDIAASKTPAFQQKFLSMMRSKESNSLANSLNSRTYETLKSYLAARNMKIEHFAKLYPWAVALTLSVIEYQRLGMVPEYGVEEYFYKKALIDNKTLGKLETLEQQMASIKAMGDIEPNLMIDYTLRDLEQLPEFAKVLKENWRSGNIESFTSNTLVKQMRTDFPTLYETLVINRNNNWLPILTLLNNNEFIEFVLVGTLHLNAKEGLIQQLQHAGFNVDQL